MNLPGRAPKAAPVQWEAMVETLTPLGEPYHVNDIVFPPGEWKDVPAALIPRLLAIDGATVRQKGGVS